MAQYIDREKFLKQYQNVIEMCGRYFGKTIVNKVIQQVMEFPTEDVVSVVRCKDCIHCSKDGCAYYKTTTSTEDYCSRGVKL